jgi:hypothetical protein
LCRLKPRAPFRNLRGVASWARRTVSLPTPQALFRNDADQRRESGEANQNSDDEPNVTLNHSASPQSPALYPSLSSQPCIVVSHFTRIFHFEVNISERFGLARFFGISASDHSLRSFITARRILLTQRIPPRSRSAISPCAVSDSGRQINAPRAAPRALIN